MNVILETERDRRTLAWLVQQVGEPALERACSDFAWQAQALSVQPRQVPWPGATGKPRQALTGTGPGLSKRHTRAAQASLIGKPGQPPGAAQKTLDDYLRA
jgi:hypothetical protein